MDPSHGNGKKIILWCSFRPSGLRGGLAFVCGTTCAQCSGHVPRHGKKSSSWINRDLPHIALGYEAIGGGCFWAAEFEENLWMSNYPKSWVYQTINISKEFIYQLFEIIWREVRWEWGRYVISDFIWCYLETPTILIWWCFSTRFDPPFFQGFSLCFPFNVWIKKWWESTNSTSWMVKLVNPTGSMGLVYLPTFTTKKQPNVGKYAIHVSYGNLDCIYICIYISEAQQLRYWKKQ